MRLRLPQAFGAAAEEAQREREARQRGSGRRLERGEIDALGAKSVIELIRRLAPGMVSGLPTQVGATATLGSGRSRSFVEEDPPVVVIDGVRMPSSEGILEQMQPSEVELLEVLPGAAAGWEYGSAGAAGVIKISRRRGIATGAVEQMEAAPCVVPEFPRGH